MQVGSPARSGGGRLYELEVVRVLTFACVVVVHVVSYTARGSVPMVGVLILAHFTREVFFALSGFVLVYSYLRRPQPMRRFWPRRFLLVGIPYLAWSVIYSVVSWSGHPVGWGPFLADLGWAVLTGTAYYHLYFLLVTMQLYLLFPLLVRLVRATRGHHGVLLVGAIVLQLVISGLAQYVPGSLDWLTTVSNVLDYEALIIGGAIAADHATEFLAWVRRHRRGIGMAVLVSALAVVGGYVLQLLAGFSPSRAATAYQPIVIGWSFVVGIGLLALGTWWVDRRPGERRVLDYLSDRSFGVFLAHPLVLWLLLLLLGTPLDALPPPVVALIAYPIVIGGALLIADVARRSPASLLLAGRPWRGARRATTAGGSAGGAGSRAAA